ncbi:MAG TPA: glycosyltransferase family 39 protein [Ktedonobacteraceae bacterium]|jgi:4-amino-4-deoxy-L-arabinose transferase-like glycosyltransferase
MLSKSSKYRKIGVYGLGSILLIAMTVLLRVVLIRNGWPPTNSDEGLMGIVALHIFNRGEWPSFVYGQNYMGTIEAYLAACFFRLLGPSLFALRLGLIVLYAGFLLALYLLARLLYSGGIALVSVFFLCLGSSDTLTQQLLAEGYLEPQLFGTLSLLLASWLALSFHSDMSSKERHKRLVAYGGLGVVIGLGFWSHPLVLPFVGASLLLLFLFCRRELPTEAGLFAVLGYLLGAFPLLLFNIQYPRTSLWKTLWDIYKAGGTAIAHASGDFRLSLLGTIAISIPTATGANPLCPLSSEPGQWVHQISLSCGILQGCWGLGAIILQTLAAFTIIREIQKHRRAFSASGSATDKECLVRCTARLMLLVSVDLTVLVYIGSPAPTLIPTLSSRYLVGLLVATPVIVGFLWPRLSEGQSALNRLMSVWAIAMMGRMADRIKIYLLCIISLVLLLGTVTTFQQIPDAQQQQQREDTLISALLSFHTPHIYSDYWTCNRLIFASNERIICASLDKNLNTWVNRYPLYPQIVNDDSQAAYVFHIEPDHATGISQDQVFGDGITQDKLFASRFGKDYHRLSIAGYAVYLPAGR